MPPARTNLQRLFAPTSVAVVGASATPTKAGFQAMSALASFGGEVFAVNPKADSVLGRRAVPSLRALPGPVDLVVFAVPAAATSWPVFGLAVLLWAGFPVVWR